MPSREEAEQSALFERGGTRIATARLFVAVDLQVHLSAPFRSPRDSSSGYGPRGVPTPYIRAREAPSVSGAWTPGGWWTWVMAIAAP